MPVRANPSALSVGIVLVPDFTMLAFAGFVDTLRLAADEGDRSRPIACSWTVMSERGGTVRASCGVRVEADSGLVDPAAFDYVVVVGGTMHGPAPAGLGLQTYLARAAAAQVPLVGVCTGSFVLARAGLMARRRCCVSWFHRAQFEAEFPHVGVVADQLFLADGDRITCAGGTSVVHLASYLVERHLGPGRSAKGLRVMIEDRPRLASAAQPLPALPGIDTVADGIVRRAILAMERSLSHAQSMGTVATDAGTTVRQLHRAFVRETGKSPREFRRALRLARARELVTTGVLPMTTIALRCGFADASHLSRNYKVSFGHSPRVARQAAEAATRSGAQGEPAAVPTA